MSEKKETNKNTGKMTTTTTTIAKTNEKLEPRRTRPRSCCRRFEIPPFKGQPSKCSRKTLSPSPCNSRRTVSLKYEPPHRVSHFVKPTTPNAGRRGNFVCLNKNAAGTGKRRPKTSAAGEPDEEKGEDRRRQRRRKGHADDDDDELNPAVREMEALMMAEERRAEERRARSLAARDIGRRRTNNNNNKKKTEKETGRQDSVVKTMLVRGSKRVTYLPPI